MRDLLGINEVVVIEGKRLQHGCWVCTCVCVCVYHTCSQYLFEQDTNKLE